MRGSFFPALMTQLSCRASDSTCQATALLLGGVTASGTEETPESGEGWESTDPQQAFASSLRALE